MRQERHYPLMMVTVRITSDFIEDAIISVTIIGNWFMVISIEERNHLAPFISISIDRKNESQKVQIINFNFNIILLFQIAHYSVNYKFNAFRLPSNRPIFTLSILRLDSNNRKNNQNKAYYISEIRDRSVS